MPIKRQVSSESNAVKQISKIKLFQNSQDFVPLDNFDV